MMNATKAVVSALHCVPDTARSAASPASSPAQLSAEDMIDFYKVPPCPRTCNHDWATCLYAHPNEKARRRSLAQHWYSAIFCVDMLHKNQCKKGDDCNLAHSVFEYWMHPDKFRTKFCKEGAECKRTICFFAHHPQELRQPGDYVPRAVDSLNLTGSPNASGLSFTSGTCGSSTVSGPSRSAMFQSPAQLSPGIAPAAAGPVGAACLHPCLGSPSSAALSGSGNSNAVAADLQTQQRIALLLHQHQQQQQQMPDTGGVAHSAAVQLHLLQNAASSQAAAELARLKVEYADRVREAGFAAAKAAEANSQLQQLAAALDAPNQHVAAATARDSPSASRRLQLEAAQRLPGNLPGLEYSPSTSTASAATAGYGAAALLGGTTGLEAVTNPIISLESQVMGLAVNSAGQAASAVAAGVLPQASAAPAPHGLSAPSFGSQLHSSNVLQSAGSWQSTGDEFTLAGILGLAGNTTESPAGSSGSQPLPGDQVLSAFLMSPQQQQHQPSMELSNRASGSRLLAGNQAFSACLLSAQHADAMLSAGSSAGHLLPDDQVLSAMLLSPQQQQPFTGLAGGRIGGHLLPGNGALSAYLLSQQHPQY